MPLVDFNKSTFPGIFIELGNGGFYGPAATALATLARMKLGNDLLDIISKRTRGIGIGGAEPAPDKMKCIVRRGPGSVTSERAANTFASRLMNPDFVVTDDRIDDFGGEYGREHTARQEVTGPGGHKFTVARVGSSAVATVEPNADYTAILRGITTPMYIALGHELIHCMHYLSGDTNRYRTTNPWAGGDSYLKHEEARTVGLGIYANTRISENALRREAKLPVRTFYSRPGDCDGLTSAQKP
jgi:hypothetical protein